MDLAPGGRTSFFFFNLINLLLAVLPLRCCLHWAFSSCGKWGLFSSCGVQASHWWLLLLQSTASRVCGFQQLQHTGSAVAALKLQSSSCGILAYLPLGMWDLPGPGIKPTSPALAGRFFTTEPPGKPFLLFFLRKGG